MNLDFSYWSEMPNAKFPSGSWDLYLESLFCFHWSYSWSRLFYIKFKLYIYIFPCYNICFIYVSMLQYLFYIKFKFYIYIYIFHVTISAHLSSCNKKYFASVLWSPSHVIRQFLCLLSPGLIEKLYFSYLLFHILSMFLGKQLLENIIL